MAEPSPKPVSSHGTSGFYKHGHRERDAASSHWDDDGNRVDD